MPKDILENIGKKLRKVRQEQSLTLQEVAERAGVTKGLISRIENIRTVPSLPVLMGIIQALNVEVSDFFSDIETGNGEGVYIRRASELAPYSKESAIGFTYFDILNQSLGDLVMKVSILELEPGSKREQLVTDGFEFKYILEGEVEYKIEDKSYILKEGDSLFFDARLPHVPVNNSTRKVKMLVVYYLATGK